MVKQIQDATSNSLRFAFDTISEANTQTVCAKALGSAPQGAAPGKVIVVLPPKKEVTELYKNVAFQRESLLVPQRARL